MKRVVITGAGGFIGANLARRLSVDGHEVHLWVKPARDLWRIEPMLSEMRLHEIDLGDAGQLTRAIREIRPEWIFHLAAHGAYSFQNSVHEMVRTNITGTINLVEACVQQGFAAFVNTGSSSEYGWKDYAPKETERADPNSYYAWSKASATAYCRYVAVLHNVRIPTLRLYSVYGPYEEPTRLIPTLIVHGRTGQLPPLVDPDVARDYVHVDDVCEAYILAATRPAEECGAIFNVGTGVQTTMREVIELARRVMGIRAEPAWGSMPNRQWDTNAWVADNEKIRRDLGWNARLSFEEGFARTVEWFSQRPQLLDLYVERSASFG